MTTVSWDHTKWRAASGHSSHRWRVVRYAAQERDGSPVGPLIELETSDGRPVLFGSHERAALRAIKLNDALPK